MEKLLVFAIDVDDLNPDYMNYSYPDYPRARNKEWAMNTWPHLEEALGVPIEIKVFNSKSPEIQEAKKIFAGCLNARKEGLASLTSDVYRWYILSLYDYALYLDTDVTFCDKITLPKDYFVSGNWPIIYNNHSEEFKQICQKILDYYKSDAASHPRCDPNGGMSVVGNSDNDITGICEITPSDPKSLMGIGTSFHISNESDLTCTSLRYVFTNEERIKGAFEVCGLFDFPVEFNINTIYTTYLSEGIKKVLPKKPITT